ncbi:MAG: response regulator transcription factor [Anaerolineae bacterium]|nr:response regulator transcription factor [Anaerolineae bacterium]
MMIRVLVVDDDPKLLKMLQRTLAYEGLSVLTAANGEEALKTIDEQKVDLMVLDWMMPRLDGLATIQKMRFNGDKTLVLMLTARDAIENRVEGLESGADDYLIKPFAPAELVARVHAMLRRVEMSQDKQVLSYANITLDPITHEARRGENRLFLTVTEFNLLNLLLRHPRQVLERAFILTEVWGYDFCGDENVLEIYIGYLRKKLEAGYQARLIQTVRGVGYVLREE